MSLYRVSRLAALALAISVAYLVAVSGVATAQTPVATSTPAATPTSAGLNFRSYIKIDSLASSLADTVVIPGQTFYADLSTDVTWIGDPNPPPPISFLQTWSVTALYKVVGIAKDGSGEQVLGDAKMTLGPFRNVKTGDQFHFSQRPALVFPDKSPFGDYTVVVRPTGVSGGPLNAFAMAWPLIKGAFPQEYAIGTVSLVDQLPTPTSTPSPAPTATPTPTPALAASATPVATAILPTATPSPTATPTPTAVPPTATPVAPPPAGGSPGWLLPLSIAVPVLAVVGLLAGVYVWRRGKG